MKSRGKNNKRNCNFACSHKKLGFCDHINPDRSVASRGPHLSFLNMPGIPLFAGAVAVIGACGMIYAGIVQAAKIAADNIVQQYAPTTSDYEVGGLFVRLFQGILCILFALAHTATAWAPVLAAVLVAIKHWHPQQT